MSKKAINSIVKKSGKTNLPKLADELSFEPSPSQLKVKTRFWSRFGSGPFADPSARITAAEIARVTNSKKVVDWWSQPGFKDWFMNQEEAIEDTKALYAVALKEMMKMLVDPATHPNARVQLFKLVMEVNDKMPSRHKEKFADEQVGKMDTKQLEAWLDSAAIDHLKRKGLKIVEEKVVNVSATDASEEVGDSGKKGSDTH